MSKLETFTSLKDFLKFLHVVSVFFSEVDTKLTYDLKLNFEAILAKQ